MLHHVVTSFGYIYNGVTFWEKLHRGQHQAINCVTCINIMGKKIEKKVTKFWLDAEFFKFKKKKNLNVSYYFVGDVPS